MPFRPKKNSLDTPVETRTAERGRQGKDYTINEDSTPFQRRWRNKGDLLADDQQNQERRYMLEGWEFRKKGGFRRFKVQDGKVTEAY